MTRKPPDLGVGLILLVLAPSVLSGSIWDYRCSHGKCYGLIRADGKDATDDYSSPNHYYTDMVTYTCQPGTAFDYGSKPNTLKAVCGTQCANNTLHRCSGCNMNGWPWAPDPKWQYSFTGGSLPKCQIREYHIVHIFQAMTPPPQRPVTRQTSQTPQVMVISPGDLATEPLSLARRSTTGVLLAMKYLGTRYPLSHPYLPPPPPPPLQPLPPCKMDVSR